MRKVSLKFLFFVSFCALAAALAAVLAACIMEPVGITDLVNDSNVQGIIGGGGTVKIITQSDDPVNYSDSGLIAGNGKISGLDVNKYYMIEEYDEDSNLLGLQFVSGGGTRIAGLGGIGKVSGGTITGLTNGNWYRVKSAKPLPIAYFSMPLTTPISISAGELVLPHNYTGDLNIDSSGLFGYIYSEVPGASTTIPSLITLGAAGTTSEYLFFDDLLNINFYVLSVEIEPVPTTSGLTITVVPYVHPTNPTFTFDPSSILPLQQTDAINNDLSFTVTVSTPAFDSIIGWHYNGTLISPTASLTNTNTSSIGFTVLGDYIFTFVGIIGGVPYNGTFTIKIEE